MLSLTRDTSPDAFIPTDHPALLLKQRVAAEFELKEVIAVGIIRDAPGGIFVPATLRRIREGGLDAGVRGRELEGAALRIRRVGAKLDLLAADRPFRSVRRTRDARDERRPGERSQREPRAKRSSRIRHDRA